MMSQSTLEKNFNEIVKNGFNQHKKVKLVCPKKWRKSMLNQLIKMKVDFPDAHNLLQDLGTFVSRIRQQDFIRATMEIKPFHRQFQSAPLLRTTISSVNLQKNTPQKNYKQEVKQYIAQNVLIKEFSHPHHPFSLIIKGFLMIEKEKYQNQTHKFKINDVRDQLRSDLNLLMKFIDSSAYVYVMVFKAQDERQKKMFKKHLTKFIQQYLQNNQYINNFIKRILRICSKNQLQQKKQQIQQFQYSSIQQYNIPQQFKIGGNYIRAMNQLMVFSETKSSKQSLLRLVEFRKALFEDINSYNKQNGGECYSQLTANIQIQIIRFILTKLRYWFIEINAQLKYLQTVYGQDQMGSNFNEASFIHCQITISLESLLQ